VAGTTASTPLPSSRRLPTSIASLTPPFPDERPTVGAFITIASGIYLVMGALALALTSVLPFASGLRFLIFGIIWGGWFIGTGVWLFINPDWNVVGGVSLLIYVAVSVAYFAPLFQPGMPGFVSFAVAYFGSLVLSVVGGVLLLLWNPKSGPFYVVSPGPPEARVCSQCGRELRPTEGRCPNCGLPWLD